MSQIIRISWEIENWITTKKVMASGSWGKKIFLIIFGKKREKTRFWWFFHQNSSENPRFSTFSKNSFDIPNFTHFRLWHTPQKMPILAIFRPISNQFQNLKYFEKKNPNSGNSISRTTFGIPTRCRTWLSTFRTLALVTYSVLIYTTNKPIIAFGFRGKYGCKAET